MADSEKIDDVENNGTTTNEGAGAAAGPAGSARSAMKDAADAWRNLGKQMREEFRAGAKDATARAMDMATDAAERANESTHGASTRINNAAVQAMNAAGEAMDKAYDAANEAADKAYEAATGAADAAAQVAGKAAESAKEAGGDFASKAGEAAAQAADVAGKTADAAAKATADLLEQAQKSASDWQDKFMRLHAEWDTYRRRTAEDRLQEKERATEGLVKDLLPVLDDFERTIAYANENGVENLLGGVEAVQSKLLNVLTSGGLETIDPQDQAFDALEHQAVGTVENTEVPDETVAQVYQKGYKMGGKVIRPAMVQVSTGGPQRPKEDADKE